jgi:hypothetical protein
MSSFNFSSCNLVIVTSQYYFGPNCSKTVLGEVYLFDSLGRGEPIL